MNRKEILNMPAGREMDLLVIEEVLKWKFRYSTLFFNEGALDHFVDDKGDSRILGFSPSTDISAAWDVVEKMREIDHYICPQIYWDDQDGLEPGCWVAEFNRYAKKINDYRHFEAVANTAPLAICRAALLTVCE